MALDTTLKVTLDSRGAEQQIQQLTSRNYGIKLNIDSQPLGRITGQLSEFNKSMDAANARVVAFGASAGAIAILEKSFSALISSTIEVQKSLKDIQVVMEASDAVIAKFGKNLFEVAKNTGQSFSEVAQAATEFSRQGLSMEDTLKRTNEALILSRLSGLGAAQSVQALTATVNSFANQAVTATEVVNKFANVDAAFAVSSKDLAEGISRVGASAAQSGVSIDELIALVTSAQQVTARGGAVIGNSFKTIFTRLERGKTQSLLESLGVDTKDESGKIKSTIDMLKDLAKVYGSLDQGKQAEVAEKVGGVFQINILKAALSDLGKQYSTYDNALKVSASSTDQAIQRNEKLNETYAAQINRLQQSATQLAASAGKQVFGPSMDRVIGAGNGILDSLNNVDSSSIGAKLGKGILDGIGQILAGPGLVMIGGVIIKLLGDFSKFAGGSVKELLGLNTASKEQAAIQASITKMLEKNPSLLAQINSEAKTQNDQAKILLDHYAKQTAEMQKQAALTAQIAGKLYTGGVRMGSEGIPVKKKASGYIPEFASEEAQAKMLGAKNPRAMWSDGTIGGQKFIKNSEETEIVRYGRNGDSAVIPHYSAGYIPNFAKNTPALDGGVINKNPTTKIGLIYGKKAGPSQGLGYFKPESENTKYGLMIPAAGLNLPNAIKPDDADIENKLAKNLVAVTNTWINKLGGYGNKISDINELTNAGSFASIVGTVFETAITYATSTDTSRQGGQGARIDFTQPNNALKKLFHNLNATRYEAKYTNTQKMFNSVAQKAYEEGLLDTLLSTHKNKQGINEEAATNQQGGRRGSAAVREGTLGLGRRGRVSPPKAMARGYIPNFADALHESIAREISAGAPANEIYVKKYGQLASENNPDGYGVFNRRDEGSMSKEMSAMRNKGYARGYIPNFADDGSETGSGGLVSGGAAALVNFAFTMSLFKNSSKEATEATRQKIEALAKEKESQIQAQQAIIKSKEAFIEANKGASNMADAVRNASRDIGFANQKITELSRLSLGQKVGQIKESIMSSGAYQGANKFLSGRGGTALTFAPIIAEQMASLIPQTSQAGRGAAQTVSSIGAIASYAGAGGMLGGPVGAGVGLAAGAALELPKIIESFTTKIPELQEKADKDKNKYNALDARSKNYLSASSSYDDALKGGNASAEELKKLSQAKQASFQQYSPDEQLRLLGARKKGGSEAEYEEAGNITREAAEQSSSSDRALKQRMFLEKDKRQITLGSEAAKDTAGVLISQITSGKTGAQGLDALKNINIKDLISADKNENQYDRANRLGGVLKTAMGGENISDENKNFVENVTNKLATGDADAAAAVMAELADKILKLKQAAIEGAKADEQAAALATQAAEKRKQEMEAISQNASAIEKQIGLIQQSTAAYEQSAQFNMEKKQGARNFSTEMSQTRRSNMEEIITSITGNTMQGTREASANKISTINENAKNKETDIMEKMNFDVSKDVNKKFMDVYQMDKKKSSGGPSDIQDQGSNIKPLMSNSFAAAESYTNAPRDVREGYISSLGANEIRRQSQATSGVQNAYEQYAKSSGSDSDKDKFKSALEEQFGKMIDSSQADSQELRNLVAENVLKGEAARQEIMKVRESATQEQERIRAELTKLVVLQGLQASAKTFGGGMSAIEGNKTTSTPELAALVSQGVSAEKNKANIQGKINSGLELSSADVGNRNIAENYMKINRVFRDKYQGGMATGENIGSGGPNGAEGLMVSSIQKAMAKDIETTRKQFKDATPEQKVMMQKSENAMIANATGRTTEEVSKLSGKDRDAAMNEALKNISLVKVAQETGDRSLLTKGIDGKGLDPKMTGLLDGMFEKQKTPEQKLLDGSTAEKEAAATLKQIYQKLSEQGSGAKTEVAKGITPVDYSKFEDDKEWRQGQEAKEKEMDRQSRIQKLTQSLQSGSEKLTTEEKEILPGMKTGYAGIATGRVNKEIAKEEAEKKKQQQQEAAGSKGGGGNVTVGAPQINITVNGGGGGTSSDQGEALRRNVASIAPELKLNIEKVVKETFERRVSSLESRVDRGAMTNQAMKPIPIGPDKSSTT
jgi:TP901 family phage tail tape measure protein